MRNKYKYTIAIDKLIFQCVGGLKPVDDILSKGKLKSPRKKIIVNEKIRLVRRYHREFGFEHTFDIFFDDFICGHISYGLTGDLKYSTKKGLSLFTCSNGFLYTENFNINLIYIIGVLGLSIRKIDDLEIAIDGNGILETANKLLNLDNKKQWTFSKNIRNRPKIAPDDLIEGYSSGIKYGNPSTKKYIVFYPKSERLKKDNKPYIIDYWEGGGLNINLPIDRCELKLNASKHITGFSLNPEDWSKGYLIAYFKFRMEDYFLFKNKKGKIKSIIDFSAIQHDPVYFAKRIYNPPNKIYGIKTAIKILYKEIGCFPCLAAYEDLLKKYKLKSWFEKARKRW
jgi:hypothetical protein